MKALERPQQWHQARRLDLFNKRVQVYLVFFSDLTDGGEEYNRFFPFTPEGEKQAEKLAKEQNETVQVVWQKIKYLPINTN